MKAALLGIERKKQVAAQIDAWAAELAAGTCPAPMREQLYRILFKPDKNAPEYKAVVEASRARSRRAARPAEGGRRDRLAVPVPLAALPVRELPEGHRLRRAAGAARSRTSCRCAGCRRSRSTTRRPPRSTTRCRCRAWAAARSRSASTSPRRRSRSRRTRPSTSRARPPVHGLHAGPQADHAARRGGPGLHAGRGPRLPGRLAVRDARRSHARDAGERDPPRARADRRQPAPRPARRRDHRGDARRRRCRRRYRSPPSWRSCTAWRGT